jgi:hypothetical protein
MQQKIGFALNGAVLPQTFVGLLPGRGVDRSKRVCGTNPLLIRDTGVSVPNTCETKRTQQPTLGHNARCLRSQSRMNA